MLEALSFLGMVLSIGGSLFVSDESKLTRMVGFYIWIVSNVLWFVISIYLDNTWMMLMYVFFLLTSIRGVHSNK